MARDRLHHSAEITAALTYEEAVAEGLPVGSQPGQARGAVDTAWRDSGEPEPVVPVAFRLSAPAPIDVEGSDLLVQTGSSAERASAS